MPNGERRHRVVDAEDVLLLMGFLWRLKPRHLSGEARAARLLDLVMDGLRRGPG